MKKILLFAALGLLLWSCRHEPPPIEPEVDYYAPHLTDVTNAQFRDLPPISVIPANNILEGKEYVSMLFNPQNPYEIAFTEGDNQTSPLRKRLYKFNFQTGKKTLIIPAMYLLSNWGKNGWLLYTGTDAQIWKVKENGDSATRLTNNTFFNQRAAWSPKNDFIVYSSENGSWLHVAKASGEQVRRINKHAARQIQWVNDTTILYGTHDELCSLNMRTEDVTILKNNFGYLMWQPDNQYYSTIRGTGNRLHYLIRGNYVTGQTDSLQTLYDSYILYGIDYAPQTKKIVGVLEQYRYQDSLRSPHRLYTTHIILFNPDGTGEKIVNIPD